MCYKLVTIFKQTQPTKGLYQEYTNNFYKSIKATEITGKKNG